MEKKKEIQSVEQYNQVSCGEITLVADIPIQHLVGVLISMLQDKTINNYLQVLSKRQLMESAKYVG